MPSHYPIHSSIYSIETIDIGHLTTLYIVQYIYIEVYHRYGRHTLYTFQ